MTQGGLERGVATREGGNKVSRSAKGGQNFLDIGWRRYEEIGGSWKERLYP